MKFKIMGKKGDAASVYEDLETQIMKFDELVAANFRPLALYEDEEKENVLLKEFDPDVETILWMPKMVGG